MLPIAGRVKRSVTSAPSGAVRAVVVALLAIGTLLCLTSTARAAIGVGTDVLRIDVPQALAAGGSYQIVPFDIINTGTEAGTFGVVTMVSSKPGTTVPTSWLSFKPSGFWLAPDHSVNVRTTITIPDDAKPGVYRIRLLGVPQSLVPSSGGVVGVGMGPTLFFKVAQPGLWSRIWNRWMPWSAVAILFVIVLIGTAIALVVLRARTRRREGAGTLEIDAATSATAQVPGPDPGQAPPSRDFADPR